MRQSETWDPLRQHLYLDKCLLKQQNTKKLQGTNNNCVYTYAEAPVLWLLDVKSQLTGKDPDAGKDWRQKETRVAELNGHESQQILGDSEGQGSLVCCSSRGRRELDMTEQLNDNKANIIIKRNGQIDFKHSKI